MSRLEDADYDGHSLDMLLKVAAALGKEVSIKLQSPRESRGKRASARRSAHALARE